MWCHIQTKTAKIFNPDRMALIPDLVTVCSMM